MVIVTDKNRLEEAIEKILLPLYYLDEEMQEVKARIVKEIEATRINQNGIKTEIKL